MAVIGAYVREWPDRNTPLELMVSAPDAGVKVGEHMFTVIILSVAC
jgi:hypothetical protein